MKNLKGAIIGLTTAVLFTGCSMSSFYKPEASTPKNKKTVSVKTTKK